MFSACKKIFFTVSLVLWMGMIFHFSSKPAVESTEMSRTVGYIVGEILVEEFDAWPEEKQEEFAEKIDYPIRKGAHVTEYAVLGFLILGMLESFGIRCNHLRVSSFCLGTMYAVSDEIHQLFVPGRSGEISDVLLDGTGVIAGIFLYMVTKFIFLKNKNNIL